MGHRIVADAQFASPARGTLVGIPEDRAVTPGVDNGSMARNDNATARNTVDTADITTALPDSDTERTHEDTIEVVPIDRSHPSASAVEFLRSARVVSDVAAGAALAVPIFRSPPRSPELDRSIRRRPNAVTVSVRRGNRPVEAVQSDLIEGVVVANDLDHRAASVFRRSAWSALSGASTAMIAGHLSDHQFGDDRSTEVLPGMTSGVVAEAPETADRDVRAGFSNLDVASVVDIRDHVVVEHASAA